MWGDNDGQRPRYVPLATSLPSVLRLPCRLRKGTFSSISGITGRWLSPPALHPARDLDLLNVLHALLLQLTHDTGVVVPTKTQVVLDLDHLLGPVEVDHQHPEVGGVLAPAGAPGDVPGVAHHEFKIVVGVDTGTDPLVGLDELVLGDAAVAVLVPLGHEVLDGLTGGDLAGPHGRVLGHVIGASDLLSADHPAPVLIQDIEGLHNEPHPKIVHVPPDPPHKLVVADGAGAVPVEKLEEGVLLGRGEVDLVVGEEEVQGGVELGLGHDAGLVPVGDAELAAEGVEGGVAAGAEAQHLTHLSNHGPGLGHGVVILLEQEPAQLIDRNVPAAVHIVPAEEPLHGLLVRLEIQHLANLGELALVQLTAAVGVQVAEELPGRLGGVESVAAGELALEGLTEELLAAVYGRPAHLVLGRLLPGVAHRLLLHSRGRGLSRALHGQPGLQADPRRARSPLRRHLPLARLRVAPAGRGGREPHVALGRPAPVESAAAAAAPGQLLDLAVVGLHAVHEAGQLTPDGVLLILELAEAHGVGWGPVGRAGGGLSRDRLFA
mmetsp:Transcript_34346/g.75096  ORF Transcript_34346/g.75096 Transcript_34346/m.75096 type:complete len:549 (+) Transcript_34346:106-1752(+)